MLIKILLTTSLLNIKSLILHKYAKKLAGTKQAFDLLRLSRRFFLTSTDDREFEFLHKLQKRATATTGESESSVKMLFFPND